VSASPRTGRVVVAAVLTILTSAILAGCTGGPSPDPSTSAPSPTPTPTPTPIVFVPDGTAEENLPWFTSIVDQVWAGPDQVHGRAYVDALVAGGFDKAAMQVTADESTVGNPAESIQFSVVWAGECLVGQVGPATGNPVTAVLPVLGTGGCMLGQTRPIDW
jgi:hypothetical protein